MLALIYIVSSARVIQARRSAKVAIGTRGNVHLERKMRVHANFAEYVPVALLLVTFIEMQGRPPWLYMCVPGATSGRPLSPCRMQRVK